MWKSFARGFSLLVFSFGLAWVVLGINYPSELQPGRDWNYFSGVYGDSWVVDGATIELPGLLRRGNQLSLKIGGWRPAHIERTDLVISVCGAEAYRGFPENEEVISLHLSAACEPKTVHFKGSNPFVPSESDRRELLVQLEQVRLSSVVGFQLLNIQYAASAGLLLFAFAIVFGLLSQSFGLRHFMLPALFGSGLIGGCILWAGHGQYLVLLAALLALLCLAVGFTMHNPAQERLDSVPDGDADAHIDDTHRGSVPFRNSALALTTLAVVLGAALRIYGLHFGLPHTFHPDEVPKVNAVMRMYEQRTLNPQYFLHPSVLLYSTYGMNSLISIFSPDYNFREGAFLAGRIVSLLAGILSILLTARIGALLINPMAGALAALILAFSPLHLVGSRYLKEDSLLLAIALLIVYFTVLAVRRSNTNYLFVAGLCVGLCASTKYSGMLTVCILGAAPWLKSQKLRPDRDWLLPTALALCIAPIGFILGTPYSILDSEAFLRDFNYEREHMIRGHTVAITAMSQFWSYHFARSIIPGMSLVGALIAFVGLGALVRSGKIRLWYIVALFLLFYLPAEYVNAKPAPQPERYIFPCIPFLALAVGYFLTQLNLARPLKIALALVVLFFPLERSLELNSEVLDDTRIRMAQWMEENLPQGTSVAVGWRTYNPRLSEEHFQVDFLSRSHYIPELYPQNLRARDEEYLVISSLFFARYFTQPNVDPALREVFRTLARTFPIVRLEEPKFGTYGFHNPTLVLFGLKGQEGSARDRERFFEILRMYGQQGRDPLARLPHHGLLPY